MHRNNAKVDLQCWKDNCYALNGLGEKSLSNLQKHSFLVTHNQQEETRVLKYL